MEKLNLIYLRQSGLMIEPIIKLFSCPLFSPRPIKHPRGLITLYLMGGIQNTNINTACTSHGQDTIVFWITKRYNFSLLNLKQISSTCFPSLNVIQGRILNCFWKTNGVRSKLDIPLNRRISCTTHYMKVKLKQRLLRWRPNATTNPLFSEHCSLAWADIIQWRFNRRTIERKYSTMV